MSNRSKKSSSKEASQPPSGKTTPSKFKRTPRERAPSPTMTSRLQEREQLGDLNDRLAIYIDRNRALENENRQLSYQLQHHEETIVRDSSKIKELYENELSDARKLLDELASQKAKLEIDCGKYKADAVDYKKKYEQAMKELKTIESTLVQSESQCSAIQTRLADALNTIKAKENEFNRLQKEYSNSQKALDNAKKQLENETMQRVDLENKLQSQKEQIAFLESVHEQQLNETRSRLDTSIAQRTDVIRVDYQNKLSESLREMREENEKTLQACKQDSISAYKQRLDAMQSENERFEDEANRAKINANQYRKEYEECIALQTKLKAERDVKDAQIDQLENELRKLRDHYEDKLSSKDEELTRCRNDLIQKLEEYDELVGIKVKLDAEINAYRKMLETEEHRLNLSPSDNQNRKRRRIDDGGAYILKEATSSSDFQKVSNAKSVIQISETDYKGNYIKLYNSSDEDVSIGGWQLSHIAGSEPITNYKFHRNIQIKPKSYITVWSSDTKEVHNPPENLVMKGQRWFTGDLMNTVLKDQKQEEVAALEMKRIISHSSYTGSSRDSGINSNGSADKSCNIM